MAARRCACGAWGCYAAAAARMPLTRYLPAVLLGESVLGAGVVYGAAGLVG